MNTRNVLAILTAGLLSPCWAQAEIALPASDAMNTPAPASIAWHDANADTRTLVASFQRMLDESPTNQRGYADTDSAPQILFQVNNIALWTSRPILRKWI